MKRICIAGINGYTGKLLKEYVQKHPQLVLVGSLKLNTTTDIDGVYRLESVLSENIDFLVLATPADISIQISEFLFKKEANFKILDLSGAFRLPKDLLKQWYSLDHSIDELKDGAKYGLSPFVEYSQEDSLIANPGCFPSCALLSLIPLLKNKVIKPENIIIDAKTGVSGAGKKPKANLMFGEMINNFFPYKINKHQHTPEILNAIKQFGVKEQGLFFTTNMLPVYSGIAMSIYVDLVDDLDKKKQKESIEEAYKKEYQNYPLFNLIDINEDSNDEEISEQLSLKNITGTANINLGFVIKGSKLIVFSSIDNLLKGAVTQAIENINNYYKFPIDMGLGGEYGKSI